MNGWGPASMELETMTPNRKPSRIPFFTQALVRQPLCVLLSGSAARTCPRFSASLNSRNILKCSPVYSAGGLSNSSSICDGCMDSLDQPQRCQNTANAFLIFRFGCYKRKPPYRIEQAH